MKSPNFLTLILLGMICYSGYSQTIQYSDSGTGSHHDRIIWLTWDHTDQGTYENSGLQNGTGGGVFDATTNTYGGYITNGNTMIYNLPGGATLSVTFNNINFTPINNPLPASTNKTRGYQPGDMMTIPGNGNSGDVWSGGALQYGYFIPGKEILFSNIGPGPSNEPGEDAQKISFDITYQLEIDGEIIPVDVIFTDGETTNPTPGTYQEEIHAITDNGEWELMEEVGSDNYVIGGEGSSHAIIYDTEKSGTPRGVPIFLNNSDQNSTTINYLFDYVAAAGGHQAFITGTLFPLDHGDAPMTYGDAMHYRDHEASSKTLEDMDLFYLGEYVDVEKEALYSADASGDGSDDDGVILPSVFSKACINQIEVFTSESFGYLSAWIDYDQNGIFENNERILNDNQVTNSSTTYLQNIPGSALAGNTFIRYRYCSEEKLCNEPYGIAKNGEVEDYEITIAEKLECELTSQTLESCGSQGDGTFELLVTGGVGSYSFKLNGSNHSPTDNGGGSYTFENLGAGNYVVEITDDNNCSTECEVDIVLDPDCGNTCTVVYSNGFIRYNRVN